MTKAEAETYNACQDKWIERSEQLQKQATQFEKLGLPTEARIALAQAEAVDQCLLDLQGNNA